jgi:hypothetical protein
MNRRTITGTLAAAVLALGAGACSDRENVEDSNPGRPGPAGRPGHPAGPGVGITPSGEEQETVTQQEGGEGE